MLFRPEEIHGASGIGEVIEPVPKGDWCECNQTFGVGFLYCTVLHFHSDRRPTVKTWCIDLNNFTRKEPADR
jgi:hypothetical protein